MNILLSSLMSLSVNPEKSETFHIGQIEINLRGLIKFSSLKYHYRLFHLKLAKMITKVVKSGKQYLQKIDPLVKNLEGLLNYQSF